MLRIAKSNGVSSWLIDLLSMGILLGIFYAAWLGSYALFTPDEGRYSEIAREMVVSGDYVTPRLNGVAFFDKPALYYWLQASAIKLFGLKEWSLRFWPACIGVLGCLIVYTAGRLLFTRRTGVISAIILATNPLYFGISHYSNLDSELTVFVSGSLLFFIISMQMSSNKSRYIYLLFSYIFCGLAILTKGLIGIAFPAMIITIWILVLNQWRLFKKIHLFSGLFIVFLITAPWYWMVQKANPQFFHFFVILQQFSRFISKADFNNETVFWFYIPVVLIAFLPWTFYLFQALASHLKLIWLNRQKYRVELFLVLWLILILIFFSIPKSKTVSRIMPVLPAMALIVGNYLNQYWENLKFRGIYAGTISFVVLCGLMGMILVFIMPFKINLHIVPYVIIVGITCLIAAVMIYGFLKKNQFSKIFYCITATSCITLLTLIVNASVINNKTIKPLAALINEKISIQDEVVSFFRYYQDLPIYIQRRITIVSDWHEKNIASHDNWKRELWFNMPFQDTSAWLIDESDFWKRWQSDKRLFVLLHKDIFERFYESLMRNQKDKRDAYILGAIEHGKNNVVILVSNYNDSQ